MSRCARRGRCRVIAGVLLAGLVALLPFDRCCAASVPDIEQQIGQMLMVGFRGAELEAGHWILDAVKKGKLGGVVLFDRDLACPDRPRNIISSAQLKRLTRQLQQAAAVPLLIAVDQEGGRIVRLKSSAGFPPSPSHTQLGESNNPDVTATEARAVAKTLAAHGINLNLAPVVDLCANPRNPVIVRHQRCFSADPRSVTAHAAAWIGAHHRQHVLTALKHFPGHGSSLSDSHLGFSDISKTWSPDELIPYRELIASGLADTVMTAHVFQRRLDADYPATLSPLILHGLLRQRLGFRGPILSDDLQMGAIRHHYSFAESIRLALAAGVDLLLFGNNLVHDEKIVDRAITVIRDLIVAGKLDPERVYRSYLRMQTLKQRLSSLSGEESQRR